MNDKSDQGLQHALDAIGHAAQREPEPDFEDRLLAATDVAPVITQLSVTTRLRAGLAVAATITLAGIATVIATNAASPTESLDPAAQAAALEAELETFLALDEVLVLPSSSEIAALEAETDALLGMSTDLNPDWSNDWTELFDEPTG